MCDKVGVFSVSLVSQHDSMPCKELFFYNTQFSNYEEIVKHISGVGGDHTHDCCRKRVRKRESDEIKEERQPLTGQKYFRFNIFYLILDTLSSELIYLHKSYE